MTKSTPSKPRLAPRTQGQLVWQQFRKHGLAVWGGRILIVLYTLALFAGFFSVYSPNFYETFPPKNNHPPSTIHWRDPDTGAFSRPFVYATQRQLDELTFQPRYVEDRTQGKFYVRFLTRTPDQPYTILRLIRSDVRLLGVDAPGRLFLMGTDNFGRDLWSRIVYGAQVSLTIGFFAALVSFVLGVSLGGVAGFMSGRPVSLSFPLLKGLPRSSLGILLLGLSVLAWGAVGLAGVLLALEFWRVTPGFSIGDVLVAAIAAAAVYFSVRAVVFVQTRLDLDDVIMRLVEILSAIPGLFLLISLRAIFPIEADPLLVFYLIVFLLGFLGWGGLARVIRGIVLSIREQDYVRAAESLGASDTRIVARHILPGTVTYLIISLSLAIPGAILGESGLSFLGLGVREPYISWGLLLSFAQEGGFASFTDRPWVLWPGFFIFLAVLSWNFLGDGLRDAFDPRKKH